MKELNQLLGLVGKEYKVIKCSNGMDIIRLEYTGNMPSILDPISLTQIPEIWVNDVKKFMIGQAGPILKNGEHGIYSSDFNRWINQNLDRILRHYKIEMITND